MNTAIENLLTRKSIRKFKEDPVPKEAMQIILEAAMQAPSACNQQPWHYIIIDRKDTLEILSGRHSGINFAKAAPAAVLVCGEPKAATLEAYWREDCAASTLNILLAAHALGLGATWSGISQDDIEAVNNIQALLGIPKSIIPFSLVVLGYPDEDREVVKRFSPQRVHTNRW